MIPEFEAQISAHVPKEVKQKINQLVKEGKFKNSSQVIREALKEFLSKFA